MGAPPRYEQFAEPEPVAGQLVVEVAAAGVHHVDLARASGTFYTGPPPIPSVVGSDGVGRTADGRRVFFEAPVPPYGSWAQRTLVSEANLLTPAEGVDDVSAAALGNTGLAAWLALSWRARVQPGESVLVLGATGALGTVAVQAAKVLGAGHVIAVDVDPDRLRRAHERGANATVVLTSDTDPAPAIRDAAGPRGVDVIIDPLWGEPALAAMRAAATGAPAWPDRSDDQCSTYPPPAQGQTMAGTVDRRLPDLTRRPHGTNTRSVPRLAPRPTTTGTKKLAA